MDITYRCMKCGSPDIEVKALYNMKHRCLIRIVEPDYECYCNNCKDVSTFGWAEREEIIERNRREKAIHENNQ